MISKKWIGATISVNKKGVRQTVTIVDDATLYANYRALGLDYIFNSEHKRMAFPLTEKTTKTKRRKRNRTSDSDIPESNEQGSVNTNGEDNDK